MTDGQFYTRPIWIAATTDECDRIGAAGFECRLGSEFGDVEGLHVKLLEHNGVRPLNIDAFYHIKKTAARLEVVTEPPLLPKQDAVPNVQEPQHRAANLHDIGQSPGQSSTSEPTDVVPKVAPEPAQEAAELSRNVTIAFAPSVDLDEVRRFQNLLDSKAKTFTYQVYDDDKTRSEANKKRLGYDPLASVIHGCLDDCAGKLLGLSKKGAGVFITVNAGDGLGRKKKNIVRVRAVFADLDGVPLKHAIKAAGLIPHIIVNSSPGRWWLYWLVDGLTLDQFREVQKAIAVKLNSDPSVIDLPRVARLPGFLHLKAEPFLSHIVYPKPDAPARVPYSAEKVLSTFPLVETCTRSKKTAAGVVSNAAIPLGLDTEQVTDETISELRDAIAFLPADDAVDRGNAGLSNKMWSDKAYQLKTLGERGRVLFHEFSRRSALYDAAACDEIFDRAEPTRTSYKAIFAEAQAAGWENPRKGVKLPTHETATTEPDAEAARTTEALEMIHAAIEKLPGDPGAVYEPDVLAAFRQLHGVDLAAFARVRNAVKDTRTVVMGEFDKATSIPNSTATREPDDDSAGANAMAERLFPAVELWPDPVDGAKLLDYVQAIIAKHIATDPHVIAAISLWCMHTWLIDVVPFSPIAHITAPTMQCGKTQLLTVMSKLTCRSLQINNIAPAALFRSIELWHPTLLIDEVDGLLKDNDDLRCLLNAGVSRDSATVIRCVGDEHIPTPFNTYGAKALCGIGKIVPTLADRSIRLVMRRRLPTEVVASLRSTSPNVWKSLRSQMARWAQDHRVAIAAARPAPLEELSDRGNDCWEPLLAIANVVGGVWPERARTAAIEIGKSGEAASIDIELLMAVREAFTNLVRKHKRTEMYVYELLQELVRDAEAPWATWNRGAEMSPKQLSTYIKSFGIVSKQRRIGDDNKKGYAVADFADVFARYLPPEQ